MTGDERHRFEEEMKVNPSLAAFYDDACSIIHSLSKTTVTELRQQLIQISSQRQEDNGCRMNTFFYNRWTVAAVSAAATLFVCLVLYFLLENPHGAAFRQQTGAEGFMAGDTLRQLADDSHASTVYYRGDNAGNTTGTPQHITESVTAILNEENPMMEKRVSLTHYNGGVEIISPKIDQVLSTDDDIIFEWKTTGGKHFYIQVFNNRAQPVFEKNMYTTRFRMNTPLSPGIYYWKLRTENETLFSGKFFIR
jgi:hypothetical protein